MNLFFTYKHGLWPLLLMLCLAMTAGCVEDEASDKDRQISRLEQQLDEAQAEIKRLTAEHGAATASLYTYLTIAIISGVVGFFIAIAIGSGTRREHEEILANTQGGHHGQKAASS